MSLPTPAPTPVASERFQRAAANYLSGRCAYSPALIRQVATSCRLDGTHRLLDLGCGPGQLSLVLSSWVGAALALDPEPEMLRIAAELGEGIAPNVEYRRASSSELAPELGQFRAAVIGRAFHWMDREDTLLRLDKLIEPEGAVVLFGTSVRKDVCSPWLAQYKALLDDYSKDDAARTQRKSDSWESHESVLLNSPFSSLERISTIELRRVSVERLLTRPLSMSSVMQRGEGPELDKLLGEIEQLLNAHANGGDLSERVESTALIARRQR